MYKDWHEKLPLALHIYWTSNLTSTWTTLFSLVYDMEVVLHVKIKIPSLQILMEI